MNRFKKEIQNKERCQNLLRLTIYKYTQCITLNVASSLTLWGSLKIEINPSVESTQWIISAHCWFWGEHCSWWLTHFFLCSFFWFSSAEEMCVRNKFNFKSHLLNISISCSRTKCATAPCTFHINSCQDTSHHLTTWSQIVPAPDQAICVDWLRYICCS